MFTPSIKDDHFIHKKNLFYFFFLKLQFKVGSVKFKSRRNLSKIQCDTSFTHTFISIAKNWFQICGYCAFRFINRDNYYYLERSFPWKLNAEMCTHTFQNLIQNTTCLSKSDLKPFLHILTKKSDNKTLFFVYFLTNILKKYLVVGSLGIISVQTIQRLIVICRMSNSV